MEVHFSKDKWELRFNGEQLIRHTPDKPFATAVRKEKVSSAKRGGIKVSEHAVETIPLKLTEPTENGVIFSGGDSSLALKLQELEDGIHICFSATPGYAYTLRLNMRDVSAVFGGGEQYRKLNLQGELVRNCVSEHITIGTILQKAVLPASLYKEKEHKKIGSYSPMPIFCFSDKTLLMFDADSDGKTEFNGNTVCLEFDSCPRSMTLIHGESFRALAKRLSTLIPNRQFLPEWCHEGLILGVQGGTKTVLDKASELQDAGAKLCGVWCQDWSGEKITAMGKQVYWNWEADSRLYPELKEAIKLLRERGIRFLSYINPYLVKDGPLYNYCRDKDYLITHEDGSIYHIASTTFDAGMLDLTNPKAAEYIKEVLIKQNMLSLGISGYMADFGEYLPGDCVLYDGDPKLYHNRWPVLWAKLNREAIDEYGERDVFFFTRSGYLGIQSYAPIMWNGDQHVDWSHDYGLPCVLPASFSLSFSGVTLCHSDIGGFFSFGRMKRSRELLIRWLELGAFSPLMRSHEGIKPWVNAQLNDKAVIPYVVSMSKTHAMLAPYLRELASEAGQGIPAFRPDFWEDGDYSAGSDEYNYFLGDDIFIAPVMESGADTKTVLLPRGQWVRFYTGEEYLGGNSYKLSAPPGCPAAFYRKDAKFSELFKNISL